MCREKLWEAFWDPLGVIWETLRGHLGSIGRHFADNGWPRLSFWRHWVAKVVNLVPLGACSCHEGRVEKPGTFSGNNNVVTGEKNRRDKARKVCL